MIVIVACDGNHMKILAACFDGVEQRYQVMSLIDVNQDYIKVFGAADSFQCVARIAREVAHAADFRKRLGGEIFQSIVVGDQQHERSLHVVSFTRL